MPRNVVTLSHLDPELHQWLKDEAARRTKMTGEKVHAWNVFDEAVRDYRDKVSNQPAMAGAHE